MLSFGHGRMRKKLWEKIPPSKQRARARELLSSDWVAKVTRRWNPGRFGRTRRGIRQFTDVRRNWFRGDRNYFFRKSRYSLHLYLSIYLFIHLFSPLHVPSFVLWAPLDLTTTCDSPLGYCIRRACNNCGKSRLVAIRHWKLRVV